LKEVDVQGLQFAMVDPDKTGKTYAAGTCNRTLAILKTMRKYAVQLEVVELFYNLNNFRKMLGCFLLHIKVKNHADITNQ